MQARTGVARLALTTDAVVLPVAQWGPQRVHDYHRKKLRLRFRRRPTTWSASPSTSPACAPRCEPAAAERRAAAGDDRPVMAARARPARPSCAASPRRRPSMPARAREPPGDRARGAPRDPRRGARRGLLGHGVRQGARRRRQRRHAAGPPRRSWPPRSASTGENPDYLPGIRLPDAVTATADAGRGARRRRRSSCSPCRRRRCGTTWPTGRRCCPPDATLLSLMKGIELGTTKRMSEVIVEVDRCRPDRVAVVSGPNLAREIAAEQPAATVVACTDADRAEAAAGRLPHALLPAVHQRRRGRLRARRRGQERHRAGRTASPRALGFGDNTKATLITRGLAETARLGSRSAPS